MSRRRFIRNSALISGGLALNGGQAFSRNTAPGNLTSGQFLPEEPWFGKAVRWAQLAFVETDPGHCDPDFWLSYFKKIHAQGALLSAGGIVAFYPTDIPLHHRSDSLGNSNLVGYMVDGCRKMNMNVCLRTDPHAARQNVYDAHPDWIQVLASGEKRRHWANPELWVTCALGPYNFDFMTRVHKEIMDRFQPDGIFSNRWAGHDICYCEHCTKNFKTYSGLELPRSSNRLDKTYIRWTEWRTERLRELWMLWDAEIRKKKAGSRFIPNGFPDKVITGKNADFFFADQQARSGVIPPWSNARGAKENRATMGMKPQVNIFSVGVEEEYRWKDSVQSLPELRIWVAEAVANGLIPCFVKFGAYLYDKRWMDTVSDMYQVYYRAEKYLRNTASMARVALVYSEQTDKLYGKEAWQQRNRDHLNGMYHALVESRIPFEMANDRLFSEEYLKSYKLLLLPNTAMLSDAQCTELRKFVERGGSIVASFETSLYDEKGERRSNFGLSDLFGVNYNNKVEGPMKNSYLKFKKEAGAANYHPILKGLEDAYRTINSVYQVHVTPTKEFPGPVTLVPTYPDLPMEDVYPRTEDTGTREIYLREIGKGRVVYIPGDIDRTFWQLLNVDHGKLLGNSFNWALNEEPVVEVKGPGVIDVTVWRQEDSMSVHLVNLTNPMMMKGPFREFIPVTAQVTVSIPKDRSITGIKLATANATIPFPPDNGKVVVSIGSVVDHEIICIDFRTADK